MIFSNNLQMEKLCNIAILMMLRAATSFIVNFVRFVVTNIKLIVVHLSFSGLQNCGYRSIHFFTHLLVPHLTIRLTAEDPSLSAFAQGFLTINTLNRMLKGLLARLLVSQYVWVGVCGTGSPCLMSPNSWHRCYDYLELHQRLILQCRYIVLVTLAVLHSY